MDEAAQKELAEVFARELEHHDVDVVLVGSTAIVASGLFHKTSKDVDVLPSPTLSLDEARNILQEVAEELAGEVVETGWGTVRLQEHPEPSEAEPWKADLVLAGQRPGEGIIPPEAAERIRAHARQTDIAPAAIPEHIVVMKAVACGDCRSRNRTERAEEYRADVTEFRQRVGDLDWDEVEQLLDRFPDARAGPAVQLLNEIFGVELPEPDRPGVR